MRYPVPKIFYINMLTMYCSPQLCGTTPCMICGSEEIKRTIEKHLNIHEGETTADGLFTLREVECLGSCANAPMIQVSAVPLPTHYGRTHPCSNFVDLTFCSITEILSLV